MKKVFTLLLLLGLFFASCAPYGRTTGPSYHGSSMSGKKSHW
jgi:hypothetical protein